MHQGPPPEPGTIGQRERETGPGPHEWNEDRLHPGKRLYPAIEQYDRRQDGQEAEGRHGKAGQEHQRPRRAGGEARPEGGPEEPVRGFGGIHEAVKAVGGADDH